MPPFPKEVRLLGKGNVLVLDGERKLAVQSRGVDHLRVSLWRVPVSQFQHLISMNRWNQFADPDFSGYFSKDNISHRWSKIVAVPRKNDWEACESVVDIAEAPPLSAPEQARRRLRRILRHRRVREKNGAAKPADDIYSRIEETVRKR